MLATYTLNADDLTPELIKAIKLAFKNKLIQLSITDEIEDETSYLLASKANKENLQKSIAELEEEKVVDFTLEDFKTTYGSKLKDA